MVEGTFSSSSFFSCILLRKSYKETSCIAAKPRKLLSYIKYLHLFISFLFFVCVWFLLFSIFKWIFAVLAVCLEQTRMIFFWWVKFLQNTVRFLYEIFFLLVFFLQKLFYVSVNFFNDFFFNLIFFQ